MTSTPIGWDPGPANQFAVRLGPLDLLTEPTHEAPRPHIYLDDTGALNDWWASAQDGASTYAHSSGDGQTAGLARFDARRMTLPLSVVAESVGFWSLVNVFGLIGRLRRETLYIADRDSGVARETDVRVTQMLTSRVSPSAGLVTLSLVADDPLLYNQGHIDLPNGSTGLPNCGDRNAYPQIELTGPIASLTIKHPGGTFSFAVPSGAHRIDCRNGTIWGPNGRQVHGAHSGAWPVVPAGGAEWVIGGSMSSAGTIKVRRWEAWS